MRSRVLALVVLGAATGCFSFSQFDREEEARNRREWVLEPEHIADPVAFHASDLPVEGLDPGAPPRERPLRDRDFDRTIDALEALEKERLEER